MDRARNLRMAFLKLFPIFSAALPTYEISSMAAENQNYDFSGGFVCYLHFLQMFLQFQKYGKIILWRIDFRHGMKFDSYQLLSNGNVYFLLSMGFLRLEISNSSLPTFFCSIIVKITTIFMKFQLDFYVFMNHDNAN